MDSPRRNDVRNLAIIAHVDHGKTTLVDGLLHAAGTFRKGEAVADCAMDSNDLERERGITILAKCTAITWKGIRINVVDTPGHADFGGEVERVLGMVDSVLLLVDAFEGPMPQTRFVTKKALAMGLSPIVVINKIDRPACDPYGTLNAVFDLFVALGATDDQLDFSVIYASGRQRYAIASLEDDPQDLGPLLDIVLDKVPPPPGDQESPLALQVATLDYDDYLGYLAVGRIETGRIKAGDRLLLVHRDGSTEEFRTQKILGFQGLKRFELFEASAGDIVAITGMSELSVGETITEVARPRILPVLSVDEPTISMEFLVSDSPFSGSEGKYVTSRNLRDRLAREIRSNVALRVEETDDPGRFRVSGRGELHLSVLIETMRREGYELCVSQPQVIFKTGIPDLADQDPTPSKLEPFEDVVIDVEDTYSGAVIEELGRRAGRMQKMQPQGAGRVRMEYLVPSRGLIGYRSMFLTDTRGTGVFFHQLAGYGRYAGTLRGRQNGVLIAQNPGETNAYALFYLQERGQLFLPPGERLYAGMIVGMHSRDNDLIVNPSRAKKLTNIRTTAADEKLILTPPRIMTLEAALEFINEDELVEVTPKSIRLRKRVLDHNARKRSEKAQAMEVDE